MGRSNGRQKRCERNDRSIEERERGAIRKKGLSFRMFQSQISKREEMAVTKEAPDRASEEEGLERLLGLPEGDHASLLSLRIPRK